MAETPKGKAGRFMKPSDRYETPPEVFAYWNRIFQFDLDVCAEPSTAKVKDNFLTFQDDALSYEWSVSGTKAWMNPPYSNPKPWIQKARLERFKGVFTFGLLPADTSTSWYHEMESDPGIVVIRFRGRIRFLLDGVRQGSPKFGSLGALFLPAKKCKKLRVPGGSKWEGMK